MCVCKGCILLRALYGTVSFTYAFAGERFSIGRPRPTPAAHLVPGYVVGLDIVTAMDATERQKTCNAQPDAAGCNIVTGCEYWNSRCGINCQRLATQDACVVSEGCSWDGVKRHCYWKVPECGPIASPTHCAATKLCEYNTTSSKCQLAKKKCGDLGEDPNTCKRSADPHCVWNSETKACTDLKPCEAIHLPQDCPGHKGCAFSQSKGACLSLAVVADNLPVCVSSKECTVAETFCNMDFGTKGYCQNCLPLKAQGGSEVCDDDKVVAKPGAKHCKASCFGVVV